MFRIPAMFLNGLEWTALNIKGEILVSKRRPGVILTNSQHKKD